MFAMLPSVEFVTGALGFEELPTHQRIVAVIVAILMLGVVIELVRKRKLREEYSVLWTVTAVLLLALALQSWLLDVFKNLVGIVEPQSALFFGGLLFLMLIALQFSVRLSKLTYRNKALTQRIALLERDIQELRAAKTAEARSGESRVEDIRQAAGLAAHFRGGLP